MLFLALLANNYGFTRLFDQVVSPFGKKCHFGMFWTHVKHVTRSTKNEKNVKKCALFYSSLSVTFQQVCAPDMPKTAVFGTFGQRA